MAAVGRGPVYRYYEGNVAPTHRPTKTGKGAEAHRYRAIARVSNGYRYLVLSGCADCSITKVDDINPNEAEAKKAQADRIASYRRVKPRPRGRKAVPA